MSAKPTPGPWRYWTCSGGGPDADYVHIAAGSLDVADVRIRSVTEADLRLMVAAPDLLEALIEISEMASRCDSWESFPHGPIEKAYAAIAKAEGK